jgi:microcystin-dependent protein
VFAPKGWALCNGQLLPINQNQALFSLLGTTFGGDGRVNFALPDLRGRDADPRRQRPHAGRARRRAGAHALDRRAADAHPRLNAASARMHAVPNRQRCSAATLYASTAAASLTGALGAAAVTNTGGSQAHLNMQPFLTVSFCIALQGIFPSPN